MWWYLKTKHHLSSRAKVVLQGTQIHIPGINLLTLKCSLCKKEWADLSGEWAGLGTYYNFQKLCLFHWDPQWLGNKHRDRREKARIEEKELNENRMGRKHLKEWETMRGNIKGVLLKAAKYMRDRDDGRPQNNFG